MIASPNQRLDKVDLEVVWETSVREAAVVSGIVVHSYDQLATEWPPGSRGRLRGGRRSLTVIGDAWHGHPVQPPDKNRPGGRGVGRRLRAQVLGADTCVQNPGEGAALQLSMERHNQGHGAVGWRRRTWLPR